MVIATATIWALSALFLTMIFVITHFLIFFMIWYLICYFLALFFSAIISFLNFGSHGKFN